MTDINIVILVDQILGKLRSILGEDAGKLAGLGADNVTRLAKNAKMIADAWVRGELTDDERDWFLDALARLAADFARTLALNTIITVERAWNALAVTLWAALRGALGIPGLPIPALPAAR